MANSMGGYYGDQGRSLFQQESGHIVPVPSIIEGVAAPFLIPLLFPVNFSYLNP